MEGWVSEVYFGGVADHRLWRGPARSGGWSKYILEEWLSGRRRRTRNAVGVNAPRGFESHLLRNYKPNWLYASEFVILGWDSTELRRHWFEAKSVALEENHFYIA